ncbi:MAG: VWA domain-containing protein [Bradymonadaceae bacterium]
MSIEFAHPWVLLLLLAVPALAVALFVPRFRARRRGAFVLSTTSDLQEHAGGWRTWGRAILDLFALVALALLVLALARPQTVSGDRVEVEGIDIFLALDMSGSMRAVDASKSEIRRAMRENRRPPNRFEQAKKTLEQFIERRKWDRIGMTVFAKEAFLQFPLTLDYRTILRMLDRLELGDIDPGGTAIGNALGRAVAGLDDSDAETKIVVLITDGDRRGGNISPMKAATIAEKNGVKIFPILVGRKGPTLLPIEVDGLGGGPKKIRYRRRKFPVDPKLLKQIADETGGEFYRATDAEKIRDKLHEILDDFERTRFEDPSNVDRTEHFRSFVLVALVLMAVQFVGRYTLFRSFP